jgi:single-strand DNA-binding protein
MSNYNKVILLGNLTRDPQLSYTPSNTPVCEFGMAVNRRWRGSGGEQKEETCFVDVQAFGRSAETINQYMAKGRSLLIEGRLRFQQWTTPEGQRRSKHSIFLENFQFVGGGRGGEAPRDSGSSDAPPPTDADVPQAGPSYDREPPPSGRGNDDIPF